MLLGPRIEKTISALRSRVEVPLAIELWNGRRYELGQDPSVTFRITGADALKRIASPDFASLGEAYIEGDLELEGPIDEALRVVETLARASGEGSRRGPPRAAHTRASDSAAIHYHYDVSDDFYRLWLDRRMVYSCAYFRTGAEDLDVAQAQKLDHVCRKLRLKPGARFLDIGCGWGALVLHAAQNYGVSATGITLSENQHAHASAQIRAAGLQDRCRVLLQDYRDVRGVYDRIASVGMFEHVGLANLAQYFGIVHGLLADEGVALNHGITSVDVESREVGLGAGEFVSRYVFPDGELPHLSLVLKVMAAAGLEVMDVETLRLHYARTLTHWSRRLEARLEQAHALAGRKRTRIWRLYLAGCAHAFARNWVSIHQVLAVKSANPGRNPLPWTRDYMYR